MLYGYGYKLSIRKDGQIFWLFFFVSFYVCNYVMFFGEHFYTWQIKKNGIVLIDEKSWIGTLIKRF